MFHDMNQSDLKRKTMTEIDEPTWLQIASSAGLLAFFICCFFFFGG